MTKNQIEYFKGLRESHDRMRTLEETVRHNKVTEGLTHASNEEVRRSNQTRERETQRSNLAQEAETARANLARETETNRANLVKEAETNRSNLANEALKSASVQAQVQSNLEQARHNQAVEAETAQANRARETLTAQSNAEAARANRANEALKSAQIQESARQANQVNAISTYDAITKRQQQEAQADKYIKDYTIQKANVQETERHNRETEQISLKQQSVNTATSVISTLGNVVGRGLSSILNRR